MFSFKKNKQIFVSPVTGTCVQLEECDDPVFSSRAMGDGVAIYPSSSVVVSPCDGEVVLVSDTKHALGLKTEDGIEVLIHIGIDTVKLGGEGFETSLTKGQKIKKGDSLVVFERDTLLSKNVDTTIFLIFLNLDKERIESIKSAGDVTGGVDEVAVLKKVKD